ncbi:hypothetical protein BDV37DRAFT_292511 [Aspergillus pseudonomiae]|uniref:Heme-binding peroxidase n=1 Tax=Aspergillus pseudonomiae TaxID=1506151 RepID=A0A5N7CSA8_9EURO|nr:uncharacterized protein BDV37DRAFT_292511 [Aspergillus pseudonomiae]KAE8397086.1 hypothetical protein BDV37DRAFT_292511 [Aspergillus pseudonomiae]
MTGITAMIKAAIRVPHMEVNRMNSARVLQCLSGEKRSLGLYTLGFSYYAEMYLAFEEAWRDLRDWIVKYPCSSTSPTYEKRISDLLKLLSMVDLYRTERLIEDLRRLHSSYPAMTNLTTNESHDMHIKDVIKRRINENPHKLLAYVWVLYSALFNGGRFIRQVILKAGPGFWGLTTDDEIQSFPPPLSFWAVNNDPEFHEAFKSRVNEAGELLTLHERQDVIQESVWILHRCKELTEELDERAKVYRDF